MTRRFVLQRDRDLTGVVFCFTGQVLNRKAAELFRARRDRRAS